MEEGHPDVLTRVSDADRVANRTAALRNFRGTGSPDEYPFASTAEGGATARVAGVPWPEQRSQGGTISAFYQSKGINPGDQFRVVIDWGDLAL